MKMLSETAPNVFPLEVQPGEIARSVDDLTAMLLHASDVQVSSTRLQDDEEVADFRLSCDGLNFWRVLWRLREELGTSDPGALGDIPDQVARLICVHREYDADEFESAKHATERRVRAPFGLDPLQLAHVRSKHRPIALLVPGLADSGVATAIASIARQLQQDLGPDSRILLPVEQLRVLLGKRKIVVSGAILRLVDAGILETLNARYHTRRAREFRFTGREGEHYAVVGDHHSA